MQTPYKLKHEDPGSDWGWMMSGCEDPFMWAIERAFDDTRSSQFHYLEIGVAQCGTLKAVCDFLGQFTTFHAFGVEPPNDPFGTRDRCRLIVGHELYWGEAPAELSLDVNTVQMCLAGSEGWRETLKGWEFDLAFIDGCHCRNHVVEDFKNVEPVIRTGGVVLFHDTHRRTQGEDFPQVHHDNLPVGVRDALYYLGLMNPGQHCMRTNQECARTGWKVLFDAQDCHQGITGFQKIT